MSSKRRRNPPPKIELDDIELQSRVCRLFLEGKRVHEIVEICRAEGISINRQQPFEILRRAARFKCFEYTAPFSLLLANELATRFPRLRRRPDVVHSLESLHIADRAAEKLFEMISGNPKGSGPRTEFHIGFAGGGLLELTARLLSDKLREALNPLPQILYFHSMVARFDDDPIMDPNSFVRYFISGPPLPLEVRFVGVMAPGFIHTETVQKLRATEGIREALARVKDLDVLVTSAGGHWTSGCSRLHKLYAEDPKHSQVLEELNSRRCIGDLMWCPLGKGGPILLGHGIRAMTLVDLNDLPGLISQGKRVMLVLAPCATCARPKTEILKTLLALRRPLLTDLVVDSFTARSVIADLDSDPVNPVQLAARNP